MQREVVVVSGVRTAIGDFGGALKDFSRRPISVRASCARRCARASVSGDEVGHVVFGNVIADRAEGHVSRAGGRARRRRRAATPALTVNRLCGSGLQAIVSAAQIDPARRHRHRDRRRRGEHEPRAVHRRRRARFGQRMGDARLVDMMLGALNDPFDSRSTWA